MNRAKVFRKEYFRKQGDGKWRRFWKEFEEVQVEVQKGYFVSQTIKQERPHSRSSRDNYVCTESSSVTWASEEWYIQKLKARTNINQGHINESKDVSG